MRKTLGQNGLNFIANKYKELRTALSKKVDTIDGKSLSTNDYDNTAKSKVDAIPSNPKYTDTTYDLSKYAEKSDIGSCKTRCSPFVSAWQYSSQTKDGQALHDWIGDFDKRTREFKDVKRYELSDRITAWKCGRVVSVFFNGIFVNDVLNITVPSDIIPISERASFLIDGNSIINYSDTKFNVSARSNQFLGYPIITYISRI